jgi:hypothetical protein
MHIVRKLDWGERRERRRTRKRSSIEPISSNETYRISKHCSGHLKDNITNTRKKRTKRGKGAAGRDEGWHCKRETARKPTHRIPTSKPQARTQRHSLLTHQPHVQLQIVYMSIELSRSLRYLRLPIPLLKGFKRYNISRQFRFQIHRENTNVK